MTAPALARSGTELLERAIAYTRIPLGYVGPDLGLPTPCERWTLGDLLVHMEDSLAAFTEAADLDRVALTTMAPTLTATTHPAIVARIKQRACSLLAAWTASAPHTVGIGGLALPGDLVAGVGALEIAVHGWDVAQACGLAHPMPPGLAEGLLELAPVAVDAQDRGRDGRFDVERFPRSSAPSDRLLAYLGR